MRGGGHLTHDGEAHLRHRGAAGAGLLVIVDRLLLDLVRLQPIVEIGQQHARHGAAHEALDAGRALGLFAQPLGPGSTDFLVVDRDPLTTSPREMAATKILAAFRSGKVVDPLPELAFR